MLDAPDFPDFARGMVNLASPSLGSQGLCASDEFFAPLARMLDDAPAQFIAGKYDDHGKWMDGWETRRRRETGHDHAVVRLGVAGIIHGVDIDTSHFTGNFPPAASIDAALVEGTPDAGACWTEIVPATPLGPDAHHFVEVSDRRLFNHLRLNIFPDGGIARLRVFGRVIPDWRGPEPGGWHELSALRNGGRIVACSDDHYGGTWRILTEGRGVNSGDGWETRRRREPGNDWIIVALGAPGTIGEIEVDTAHYKGNYPDACSLQAHLLEAGSDIRHVAEAMFWPESMAPHALRMDHIHRFDASALRETGPVSHVKLNLHPDGGISRFRVFGTPRA